MSAILSRSLYFAFLALVIAWCAPTALAQSSSSAVATGSPTGILLLAHGGSKDWNANVQAIAADVNKTEPTEVAFGMADRATLQAGIDQLTARGVKEIIAVPLFVSSHSSVIEATKYLLGLRPDAPPELMDFTMDHGHGDSPATAADKAAAEKLKGTPVKNTVPLRMAPALDRHAILADILTERATAISKKPAQEVVVLVAHGPNENAENELWLADLRAVAKMIAAKNRLFASRLPPCVTTPMHPVQEQATQQLRSIVSTASDQGYRVLIVPVLLSYGGIENGIRKRLDGLDHVMSPSGILPDPRIVEWVTVSSNTSGKK